MTTINDMFLSKLSTKYELKNIQMFEEAFSSFCLLQNNRIKIYLILCRNNTSSFEIDFVLNKISLFEANHNKGSSYLCVMPTNNPSLELCTHCNGKSFVHFIFFDNHTNQLLYDKKIYYFGSKLFKQLIDIYQECFDRRSTD